jgi:hypothetical protein
MYVPSNIPLFSFRPTGSSFKKNFFPGLVRCFSLRRVSAFLASECVIETWERVTHQTFAGMETKEEEGRGGKGANLIASFPFLPSLWSVYCALPPRSVAKNG